jgi:predicted nucleic acid-binding protein
LASESNANFLITGNTNDFTMKKYRRTSIVSPKDYWNSYKPKN